MLPLGLLLIFLRCVIRGVMFDVVMSCHSAFRADWTLLPSVDDLIPLLPAAISLPSHQGRGDKDAVGIQIQSRRNQLMIEHFSVCVCLCVPHLAATHSLFLLFCLFLNRLRRCVAMATVAPPFFLLCWLLQTASSAFPEEPGPLNFIPTEGTDLPPDFLAL